jgi:hypothetical protein
MTIYKTTKGKPLDMSALIAQNEKVRAVGNANLNARGDLIDGTNNIVQTSTERVRESYSQTIGNAKPPTASRVDHSQLSPEELEFELEEVIKKEVVKKGSK